IPDRAADSPAARGSQAEGRLSHTGSSGRPSPDRDRGTRRERVRTAVARLRARVQTLRTIRPAYPAAGRSGAAAQTAAAWARPVPPGKALRHGFPTATHRDTQ